MAEWMISSGILILLVIGVRQLMKNRISPLLQYALWLIVLVRLLLPFNLVNSGISVMNMVKPVEKVIVLTQSGADQSSKVLPSTSAAATENTLDFAATSQAQASEPTWFQASARPACTAFFLQPSISRRMSPKILQRCINERDSLKSNE